MNRLATFPPAVRSYLRAFVARRRAVTLVRGMGFTVAVVAGWVLACCLLDRATHLAEVVRRALVLGGGLLAAAVAARSIRRAIRPVDWLVAVAQIEQRTDRFAERLQTVTSQLLGGEDRRGSAQMLAHTMAEVESLAANAEDGLIPWRCALPPWLIAGAIAAAFGILWPIAFFGMPRLLARFVYPTRKIEPVTVTLLDVTPKGTEIDQGGSVMIEANPSASRSTAGPRAVELYLSSDGRNWSHAAMSPVPGGSGFTFSLPAVDRDLRYYLRGGDATTDIYDIRVKRVPAAAEFHIRYTFPDYTAHLPTTVINTDGLIEALVNSQATVTFVATEPLKSAVWIIDDARIPMSQAGKSTEWQANLVVKNANCALEMVSEAGVAGRGPSPMYMRALPDRPPTIVIQQPADDLRLSPVDSVTMRYGAVDDYGLTALEAEVRLNGAVVGTFPIKMPSHALRREGELTFDLGRFDAKIGDVVTLSLHAEDSDGNAQAGEPRRVLIAPVSVGVKAYARAAELRRCATLAGAWVESLGKATAALDAARRADPRTAKQDLWVKANRAFATASEAAASLRQSLLRVVLRTESPALSTALANLIDETHLQVIDSNRALSSASRADDVLLSRLNAQTNRARELVGKLRLLAQGEQAALALAELGNLKVVSSSPPLGELSREMRAKAIARARQALEATLRELQLSSGTPGVEGQLQQRLRLEREYLTGQRPIDLLAAAHEWADRLRQPATLGAEFPARLAAAAQAEALRPDADLILARDLQLAARAAASLALSTVTARESERGKQKGDAHAKIFEPLAAFEAAFGLLARDREHPAGGELHDRANEARAKLRTWAGEAELPEQPDDLAFEAGAASARGDGARAAALDEKLAEEIARSSQEESARFAEDVARRMNQAAAMQTLIGRQEELLRNAEKGNLAFYADPQAALAESVEQLCRTTDLAATTQPSPEIRRSRMMDDDEAPSPEAAARNPLGAAAWHARAAAEALSAETADRKTGLSRQRETLALLRMAWSLAVHQASARRLEETPALAPLFLPYAAEEGGPGSLFAGALPRFGTRLHDLVRAGGETSGAATRESEPAGYQDQLKAYFDGLTRPQGKR